MASSFTAHNIKHLPTTTTISPFYFLSSSSSNAPPPILSSVSMALIGYSEAGTAGSTSDRRPSHPVAPSPSQTYIEGPEPALTNIWRSALSGRVADREFSHNNFYFFFYCWRAGQRNMQLSIALCVSTRVFVSDFPARVCMHLCVNVSR